ncbi:hypothetical protein JI59_20660 (plasmid) [Novosphingobium pentaromativorans US6-1]|uniref:Uncharacterized protein n=2 Tax=Novosphingobium pentaromativorans TaxID=205844 RepID=G6EH52_9SPHN|nr:hypothetical protein JI59_20660 [Novosphingobium pentaromativorans US6-1]EHJ59341.1 hypothetical protein NSU_3673 [Novosphingobium pentaromativorans US6-1]
MPQTSPHDWVLATENEAGPAQLHVIFSMLTEPACHHVRGEMVTGDCRFGSTSSDEKLRRVKRQRKIEVDLTQTEWTELMED